jgi:pSer/pThr/pTyr-binding forkhead associated (FHA) protein
MGKKKDEWNDERTGEINVSLLPHSRESKPFLLRMVQGPGAPRVYELFATEMVVGRSAEADIPINSTDLSRRHMILKRTGSQFSLIDLDSRNGIYLNGVRIHSAVLHEGDNIQLGMVVFVFHEGRP